MRKRIEIEESFKSGAIDLLKESSSPELLAQWAYLLKLQLEVLLDIRELKKEGETYESVRGKNDKII